MIDPNLEVDVPEQPTRVDGMTERKLLEMYQKEAHEKQVKAEHERVQRNKTIRELVLIVLVTLAICGLLYYDMILEWLLQ